jgi:2-methylisocitrate lyase-like PEP mutase family enzyme
LNEGEERDSAPDQVDFRDDRVEIDLLNREEIESALKYLKNNKAAGADSIVVELLNGVPQLVDALKEVNQLAWTIKKTT